MIVSKLRFIMEDRKLTIAELSKLAHISPDTISRMRKTVQINECKLGSLEKVAKALNCKVKDLFIEER